MDKQLHELMARETPHFNENIVNGLATLHVPYAEQYINDVMHSAAKGFPKGLEYLGCKRCTPYEEFHELTRIRNNRRTLDTARSDIYMMKYFFRYQGKDLPPRFLQLPFVSDAACIIISGSRFTISPVLSDKVISPGMTNVFIRLLRDKLTFERTPHNVVINNVRETVQVVWSLIYHKPANLKKIKATVKANCSLVHYLLCKYGFTEMFNRFGKCNPVVGEGNEITEEKYPRDNWVIVESTQVKPKGFGKNFYTPTMLKLAIPKNEFTPMVKSLVTGFFYIVDHFPSRIIPSYLDHKNTWTILFGHILFSGVFGEGKLLNDASNHFKSLDEYIDNLVKVQLKEIGYPCDNIYELFVIVIENFNAWLLGSTDKVSSMYGKELSILYHLLEAINNAIFNLNFKLKTAEKNKELSEKQIISIMNMVLRTGLIFSITKQHISMSTVSYSGDNKFLKITNILIPQSTSGKNSAKKSHASISDPLNRLDSSIAEVGGYLNLPKSGPDGRHRINPYLQLNDKSITIPNPRFVPLLSSIQTQVKRN